MAIFMCRDKEGTAKRATQSRKQLRMKRRCAVDAGPLRRSQRKLWAPPSRIIALLAVAIAAGSVAVATGVDTGVTDHDDGWNPAWDPGEQPMELNGEDNTEFIENERRGPTGSFGDGDWGEDDEEDDYDEEGFDASSILGKDEDKILQDLVAKEMRDVEDITNDFDFGPGTGLNERSTFEEELAAALKETIPDHLRVNEAAVEEVNTLAELRYFVHSKDDPELVGGAILGLFNFGSAETPTRIISAASAGAGSGGEESSDGNTVKQAWRNFLMTSEILVAHGFRFVFTRNPKVLAHYNVTSWDAVVIQPPMLARAKHGDVLEVSLCSEAQNLQAPEKLDLVNFVRAHAIPKVMLLTYETEDAVDAMDVPVLTVHGDFDREKTPELIAEYVDMLGRISQALGSGYANVLMTMAHRGWDSSFLRFFSSELACTKTDREAKGRKCVTMRVGRNTYYKLQGLISEESIGQFAKDVLEGRLKPVKLDGQARQAAAGIHGNIEDLHEEEELGPAHPTFDHTDETVNLDQLDLPSPAPSTSSAKQETIPVEGVRDEL